MGEVAQFISAAGSAAGISELLLGSLMIALDMSVIL